MKQISPQAYVFILNAASGSMDVVQVQEKIKVLSKKYEVYSKIVHLMDFKSLQGHIEDFLCTHPDGVVVAAGGDGTVASVGNILCGKKVPLGILPLGTANIFARSMGLPMEYESVLELLFQRKLSVKEIDAMRVGEVCYFLQITIGFSSEVTHEADQGQKKLFGRLVYFVLSMGKIFSHHARKYYVTVDGVKRKVKAIDLIIANAPLFLGSSLSFGEHIEMADGKMDLCLIRPKNIFDYFRIFYGFFVKEVKLPSRIYLSESATIIRVQTKKPIPVHADGEIISNTPVEATLLPKHLHVLGVESQE